MNIVISNSSEAPIYRQIFEQLSGQIIRGELASGEALPPIRTVAKELRVSVITVKRAWEELERGGFIDTMVGRGCFVAPLHGDLREDKRLSMAEEQLEKDLNYYRTLGLTREELVSLVERNYTDHD